MILPNGHYSHFSRTMAATYGDGTPRWIWLALPEDAAQEAWLAVAELGPHARPAAIRKAVAYRLRELARTCWRRDICRPAKKPTIMRPSKQKQRTGYRADAQRKSAIRLAMPEERRREIAAKGRV